MVPSPGAVTYTSNSLLYLILITVLLLWGCNTDPIYMLQKKDVRAIFHLDIITHTERLFKLLNVLKMADIYNYRLLILYCNLQHANTPVSLDFLPNISLASNSYPIKNPILQPPKRIHEYISKTCRYQLPILINSKSNSNNMKNMFLNINTYNTGFQETCEIKLIEGDYFMCEFQIVMYVAFRTCAVYMED